MPFDSEFYNNPLGDLAKSRLPDINIELPKQVTISDQIAKALRDLQGEQSAQRFVMQIIERIEAFEANLDDSEEVGIRLVSFGQSLTFHVSELGFIQPSLVIFKGYTEGGEPIELIQHTSQISFLLMVTKRLNVKEERRKIGFIQPV
ncbi:DUF6173 family protein [Phormidium tenue]|jgi:hypothetical protein|uniref:Uncharacterized protein n=1 Tax=Phormidium tenue FACHB-1050 TaxID=2692857 RepID=A0ABR8C4E7_9CYAN|nr:DUF6173 family protein [Phormidium tenue]MBD2315519.1 hypothetical protein [Phormidium tenue FACHB-1050]